MKLKLVDNWKLILRKAWSVKFMVLAGLLSAVEVMLPMFASHLPRNLFAALSGLAVAVALVARIYAQKDTS